MWKALVFLALGLIAGYALSGIPARRELAALRSDREALRAQLAEAGRPNLLEAFLPGLSASNARGEGSNRAPSRGPGASEPQAARAPTSESGRADPLPAPRGDVAVIGAERDAPQARSAVPKPGSQPMTNDVPSATPAPAAPSGDRKTEGERFAERSEQFLARFDELVAAQRVRTAAARSALIEQAGLDDEAQQQLDGTVQRMNQKLEGYGQEMIDQAASEKPPSPSQALGLGHDVSGILYEGQQQVDALVGDKAKAVDASALQIWNYVDVGQWRQYVEQQRGEQNGQDGQDHKGGDEQDPSGQATGAAGKGAATP